MKGFMLATALAFCAGAASAGENQVFLLGGLAIPTTKVDFGNAGGGKETIGTTGGFVGGQFFHAVHPRVSLGGELAFLSNGESDLGNMTQFTANASMKAVSFLALLKGYFNDSKSIRFYGSGGIGAQNSQFTSEARPRPGFVWGDTLTTETRHFESSSVTAFAYALGFGFEGAVTDAFLLGAEARFQGAAARNYGLANGVVNDLRIGNFILAAKAGLSF